MMKNLSRPYPQDLISNFPPKQEGKCVNHAGFSAFAISLQGASHVKKEVPCQDYSDIRILEECGIMLGGIADGVGSCPLSHWGSYIAVNEALDYAERSLKKAKNNLDDNTLNIILNESFEYAAMQVEKAADASGQAVRNLQSTLTVVIYNGMHLYCCHVGDDGVAAQEVSGGVKLATKRHKGEEAGSVYPLQSGKWEITKIKNPVAGFVMATDGVLDAFALEMPEKENQVYFNRIYYPFMEPAIYGLIDSQYDDAARETMESYKDYLNRADYRSMVVDDLTFVAAAAGKALSRAKHPEFDIEAWNTSEKEIERRRRKALGYVSQKGKEAPGDTILKEAVSEREKDMVREEAAQESYDESDIRRDTYARSERNESASKRRANGNRMNGNRMNGNRMNGDRMNGNQMNGDRTKDDRTNGDRTKDDRTNSGQTNGNRTKGDQTNNDRINVSCIKSDQMNSDWTRNGRIRNAQIRNAQTRKRRRMFTAAGCIAIAAVVILTACRFCYHFGLKKGMNIKGEYTAEEITLEEITTEKNERYLEVKLENSKDSTEGRKATPSDAGHDSEINTKRRNK